MSKKFINKDIYYDNGSGSKERRTIALVGMGPGGKGYFALDITDTEKPTHLFSFDNDPVTRTARFWNDDGDEYIYSYSNAPLSSVAPDYDYSNLGNAYSTPHILRMGIDGDDKWVAVFGGGYNIGSMEYASSIFVVDLEDGGINNAKRGGKLIKDINFQQFVLVNAKNDGNNTPAKHYPKIPKCGRNRHTERNI